MSRWKPGQLVTINGIVYRVKRRLNRYASVCHYCGFNTGTKCKYPMSMGYRVPGGCYLKRLSP